MKLLGILVVMVIGAHATPDPRITVSNENPQKGDVLTLTCTCPIPNNNGTELTFHNYECVDCGLYMIGSYGKGPEPDTLLHSTMGEEADFQLVNDVLSIGVTVKLTCAHTVKYECQCEESTNLIYVYEHASVKKELPIGGC